MNMAKQLSILKFCKPEIENELKQMAAAFIDIIQLVVKKKTEEAHWLVPIKESDNK